MSRRILCSLALVLSMFAALIPGVAGVSAQTDLAEGTYVDPNFAFSVTWDPDVFEGEEIVGDEDPFGVTLTATDVFGQIWAGGYSSPRNCVNSLTGDFADIEGVSNFEESSELNLPETDPDARAEVYSYDYENPDTGDEGVWAHYFECRDLLVDGEPAEDVVLAISIDIAFEAYDTLIRDIEDVLGSIEFDATGGNSRDNGGSNGGDNGGGGELGLGDGTFVEPVFLWGMSWDPDAYDAEEIITDDDELYGVTLSGPGIYAQFFSGAYSSTRNCLNTLADNLEGFEGVSNFEEADDLDLLETGPDVRAGMYRYDFENADGDQSSWARYFECREILVAGEPAEDAILAISIDFAEDEYDTVVDDFEPILASIEFDAASSGGNGRDDGGDNGGGDLEPGVDGNVYLDPEYGFTVTWNERDFTGENWDPEESGDIVGLQLVAESGGFMTVFVQEASSVRSCANNRADELSGGAFDNFEEVDLQLPDVTDGTRQAIWQGIFTNSEGDESDIILYSQCSPIIQDGQEVEDVFLAVDLIASPAQYEELIPGLSEVLTSFEFDAASGGSNTGGDSGDDPTPDPDEVTESCITGGTYTSSLGYAISWDDSTYTAELLDEENPDLGISISGENTFMQIQVAGDPTLEVCVEAEADVVAGLSGISDFGTSRLDGPEPGRGVESGTYGATLELSNGDQAPVFIYIQCTELGEVEGNTLAVIVRMIGFEDTYEDELPLWQEILDSLEIA